MHTYLIVLTSSQRPSFSLTLFCWHPSKLLLLFRSAQHAPTSSVSRPLVIHSKRTGYNRRSFRVFNGFCFLSHLFHYHSTISNGVNQHAWPSRCLILHSRRSFYMPHSSHPPATNPRDGPFNAACFSYHYRGRLWELERGCPERARQIRCSRARQRASA